MHRFDQHRGEKAAAFGRVLAQVDGGNGGELGAAVAGGQAQVAVAAPFHVGEAFQAGRGADQHGGCVGEAGADHGHVARVVDHAVFLLEGGFVFLVDHHQAEFAEGQEQGGAGADDDARLAIGHGAPGGAAHAGGQIGMPERGRGAEAGGEAIEELRRERDFRQQDERLAAGLQAGGDGFEVGFGFARAGDAVEQGDAEGVGGDSLAELGGDFGLFRREGGRGVGGIGDREGAGGGDGHGFEQPGLGHGAQDGGADAGVAGQVRTAVRAAIFQGGEHALAGGGEAWRGGGRAALPAGGGYRRGQGIDAECHGQHLAGGGQRVGGHPVDEAAQGFGQAHGIEQGGDGLQLGVGHGGAGGGIPHHARLRPAIERHQHHVAGFGGHAGGQRVVERAGEGVGQQHRHAAWAQGVTFGYIWLFVRHGGVCSLPAC